MQERKPDGIVERALVEEIAVCLWKIADAAELQSRDLRLRDRATTYVIQTFAKGCDDKLPFDAHSRYDLGGLECKELLLRMAIAEKDTYACDEDEEKREHTLLGARLGNSLETTMRYTAALKRDLYRAIDKLESLQNSRKVGAKTNDLDRR